MYSGSDGDLMFRKIGAKDYVPYYPQSIPQICHTSNEIFCSENQGDLELVFPEFFDSRRIRINLDIVQYDPRDPAPMFDLIIGTETMSDLGIILY